MDIVEESNSKKSALLKKYQKSALHWKKDCHINFISGNESYFDDFFSIYDLKNHRIKRITIWADPHQYVNGFETVYEGLDGNRNVVSMKGLHSYPPPQFRAKQLISTTLELSQHEYVVEIFGRKGNNIDCLGFKTNLGKTTQIGNQGGVSFSVQAPQGCHFSCLSAACDNSSLKQIRANVYVIGNSYAEDRQSYKFPPVVFKRIVSFLSFKDIGNIFLCKGFSHFRHDSFVINQIGRQCIFSCNENNIEFLKQLIKSQNYHDSNYFEYLSDLIEVTRNRIDFNKIQDKKTNYFSIKNNEFLNLSTGFLDLGHTFCLETSYQYSTISFERKFEEVFSEGELEDIMKGQYGLVTGVKCKDSGLGGEVRIQLNIRDSNSKIIYELHSINDHLSMQSYQPFYFLLDFHTLQNYIKDVSSLKQSKIYFEIKAKDAKVWSGFYGPKISNIFLRILPISLEDEQIQLKFTKRHSAILLEQ